jgi:hypothetical protein
MSAAEFPASLAGTVLHDAARSSDVLRETGSGSPSEMRLHFSGYECFEGRLCARSAEGDDLFQTSMGAFIASIPAFTPETRLATDRGEIALEDLDIGQKLLTRDHGLRVLKAVSRVRFGWRALALNPLLRPISIAPGALGGGHPEREILAAPSRRFLLRLSGHGKTSECWMRALDMLGQEGVALSPVSEVTYLHLDLGGPAQVLADGCWCESGMIDAQDDTGAAAAEPAVLEFLAAG